MRRMELRDAANELVRRLAHIFLRDKNGRRACHGADLRRADNPPWRGLVWFNESFSLAIALAHRIEIIESTGPNAEGLFMLEL